MPDYALRVGSQSLQTQRFRRLLAHLQQDYRVRFGKSHGFQGWFEAETDVSQSLVSQVLAGTKGVGDKTIEKATKRFKIPREFFYERLSAPQVAKMLSDVVEVPHQTAGSVIDDFVRRFGDRYSEKTVEVLRAGVFNRDGSELTLGALVDRAEQLEAVWRGEAELVIKPKG
ncbi:MAG: hypothetical protein AAGE52_35875 [Myxococcota bacterium]